MPTRRVIIATSVACLLVVAHSAGLPTPGLAQFEESTFAVVNRSPSVSAVVLHEQAGSRPVTGVAAACSTARFDDLLPRVDALRPAFVSSVPALAVLTRVDSLLSGAIAFHEKSHLAKAVIVPLVAREFHSQSSRVRVSAGARTTGFDTEIAVNGPDGREVATMRRTVGASGVLELDLREDAEFAVLGEGFVGTMRVSAPEDIAVTADMRIARSVRGVYSYSGVPIELSDGTVFLPLFRSGQRLANGRRADTGIAIANTAPRDVTVTIEYHPSPHAAANPACRSIINDGPFVLPIQGSRVVYHGPGGDSNVPDNCFGSAVVRASGTVTAMVNEAIDLDALAAAYNGMIMLDAAVRLAVPIFQNDHVGASTGIQVMNASQSPATVTVNFSEQQPDGTARLVACPAGCQAEVAPGAAATWWPPAVAALGKGTFGTATIESSERAVAIVNRFDASFNTDMATYVAIGCQGLGSSSLPVP